MFRYKLKMEYDGTPFAGWQRQKNDVLTVQGLTENAVFRMCGHEVTVYAAGRTDAGVHAEWQIAHFDLPFNCDPYKLMCGINHFLRPFPVAVLDATIVTQEFHSRFSATMRQYRYDILCRRGPAALEKNRVWHVAKSLDTDAMREGALHLTGKHDFTTFRAAECQANSPVRSVESVCIDSAGEKIMIKVTAKSFLHRQIRGFAGTLKKTGEGALSPDDVRKILEMKDRSACPPLAPPEGLFLTRVWYDESHI